MLRVVESNRLEALAERLRDALATPSGTVLVPEIVVVPNRGMGRWLALDIAAHHGICAGVRFVLAAQYVWETFDRVLGVRAQADVFDPRVLTWRVFAELGRLGTHPRFEALRAYAADEHDRGRYELAWRIADVFDQYLVYRPDWIRRWEAGGDEHWQAELWRRIVARADDPHRVTLLDRLVARLAAGPESLEGLPARLFVFGLSAMPPAYLAVFGTLATSIDVTLLVASASPEYAGDLETARDRARRARPLDDTASEGNVLLAALGKQGAEFRDLWLAWGPDQEDRYEPPGEDTVLHALQSDVYHLRTRGSAPWPTTPRPDDGTVQIHACHGPMREIEVLHDQLLALFERHPDLVPADVVVMMPDVETYAPSVEAVFGTAPAERRIPFTIADRVLQAERPLVRAFLAALELPGSRFDANRLLALLDVDAVRRRFGFTEVDTALVRQWVRATGIRWGVDAAARGALGLPATVEHTWRFGLDRLLLGYAWPSEGRHRFGGILPYDGVEGTAARALGLLSQFVETCVAVRERLAASQSAELWTEALQDAVTRLFAPGPADEGDLVTIGRTIGDLAVDTGRAAMDEPISLDLVRAHCARALGATETTGRFLAGKVTFAALVPMRAIPFAVVCLLGLDDGRFPRPRRALGFDLMADDLRPGDRSRRDDDRALFLDAIVAARRVLYVSYTGRDIRDNSEIPPSTLVADLRAYLQRGFAIDPLRIHPLQPFSERYFTPGSDLPSYAEELAVARRGQGTSVVAATPFLASRLPAADPAFTTVTVDDFVRFFQGPARFMLTERLGVRLEPARGEVETREPFVLDALERYQLRDEIVRLVRGGVGLEEIEPVLRAAGRLPHGMVGAHTFAHEHGDVTDLLRRLADMAVDAAGTGATRIETVIEGFRIHGVVPVGRDGGVFDYRVTRGKARDRVGLWIRHLLLAHATASATTARWLGTDDQIVLRPVAAPAPLLADLLDLYWDGLHRPLPFFPRASDAAHRAGDDAISAARGEWMGSPGAPIGPGEGQDPYNALAFRGRDPFAGDFLTVARRVLQPLLAHEVAP